MKTEKNIYRKLSQKITISLAQQMELKHKSEMLQQHNSMLESRIEQLLKELKALSDENSDLKEIVFTLNQENERLRP